MRILATDIVLFLLLALAAVNCFGQVPVIKTKAGDWQVNIDSLGVPSLVKIDAILDLRNGGGNTPTDTPDTPKDEPESPPIAKPDATIAREVEAISKAVGDPQGAQGLSRVYRHVAGAVNDEALSALGLWPVIKTGSDTAVVKAGTKDWTDARAKLGALITKQQQSIKTKEQLVVLLCSIQYGLELAADGSAKLSLEQQTAIYSATQGAIDASR